MEVPASLNFAEGKTHESIERGDSGEERERELEDDQINGGCTAGQGNTVVMVAAAQCPKTPGPPPRVATAPHVPALLPPRRRRLSSEAPALSLTS